MAHYDKFKITQAENLFRHCERYKREDGSYYSFGNQNIDTNKSHLNYNLAPALPQRIVGGTSPQYERMKGRLDQLQYRHQKNNVVVCSWVITAPKEMKPEDYRQFFETAYKEFCRISGGERNVISAFVHMDETTPHMHFLFVPAYRQELRNFPYVKETLSASKLITRKTLQHFHDDMQKAVDSAFPEKNYRIVAEDTRCRVKDSKSLADYKKTQDLVKLAQQQLDDVTEDIESEIQVIRQYQEVEAQYKRTHEKAAEILRLSDIIESQNEELAEFDDFLNYSQVVADQYKEYRQYLVHHAIQAVENTPGDYDFIR